MSYSNSAKERPKQPQGGGRGVYCCVPECLSSQYDRDGQKRNISLFSFPDKDTKPEMFRAWKKEISKYRRKGQNDNFEIKKSTKVCEFHFKPEEIRITLGHGKKKLHKDAVPSIYSFKHEEPAKRLRRSPRKRLLLPEKKPCLQQKQNLSSAITSNINKDKAPMTTELSSLECRNCIEDKTEIEI